jgi:hypothetical protein
MIKTGGKGGRTGNWLFQYCVGRILAEELGYALDSFPIPEFPGCVPVDGMIFPLVEEKVIWRDRNGFRRMADILDESVFRTSIVGGPQNYEYLRAYRPRIQKWLGFDFRPHQRHEVIGVHVRLTDYVNLQWAMSPDFYTRTLDKTRHNKKNVPIRIITDDPTHPMMEVFGKYPDCEILDLEPRAAMDFLACCRWSIISQSTFAWWPCWLSDIKEACYFPLPNDSLWSPHFRYDKHGTRHEFVNLFDPDHFVPVHGAQTIKDNPMEFFA